MGVGIAAGTPVSAPVPPLPAGALGAAAVGSLLESDPHDALPPHSKSAKMEHVVNALRG
jgi:hypothetical protein